ncbi:hypothetical protein HDU82_003853 [Entophlyctis luteolus]|nr:hypothetical protein HDU82_003853 [Entophlyctis luteolus]
MIGTASSNAKMFCNSTGSAMINAAVPEDKEAEHDLKYLREAEYNQIHDDTTVLAADKWVGVFEVYYGYPGLERDDDKGLSNYGCERDIRVLQ